MEDLFTRTLLALLPAGVVALAFYLILRPIPGMDSVFQGIGRGLGWAAGALFRLTIGVGLLLVFTAADAAITTWLAAYHALSARPWLVPEDWAAFLQRFSDRAHRTVLNEL